MKDYKLYNSKDNTRLMVDFSKDVVSIVGEIVSHKDGVYDILLAKKKHVSIKDAEVDRVEVLEDEGLYQLYLVTDISNTLKYWREQIVQRLGFPAETPEQLETNSNKALIVEKSNYDIGIIIDQLYEHTKDGLKSFYEKGTADVPYYPLAYVVVMDLLHKMFGGFMAMMIGSSPLAEVMVLCWLHGYLTSSAMRKQAIKSKVRIETVSAKEIEEKSAEQAEFMKEVIEKIQQHIQSQGESDERGPEEPGTES